MQSYLEIEAMTSLKGLVTDTGKKKGGQEWSGRILPLPHWVLVFLRSVFTITVHMASSNGREKVTWRVGDSWQTGQLKEY